MPNPVLAVVASDLHISHTCPVARSAEPDWYAAQARALDELRSLTEAYQAPLVVAGDVFDRWNPPPETINFAIDRLPPCYAVPGQHDLPNHRYDQRDRSAYGTLVRAGVIRDLEYGHGPTRVNGLLLSGFPWGCDLVPNEDAYSDAPSLAVVHAYVWAGKAGYPGAEKSARAGERLKALAGYTGIVTGDNHQGFGYRNLFNPGTLLRRKTDEREYRPQVGLWRQDGTFDVHYLSTEQDKWAEQETEGPLAAFTGSEFVDELRGLADGDSLDFRAEVLRRLDVIGVPDGLRGRVLGWLGG